MKWWFACVTLLVWETHAFVSPQSQQQQHQQQQQPAKLPRSTIITTTKSRTTNTLCYASRSNKNSAALLLDTAPTAVNVYVSLTDEQRIERVQQALWRSPQAAADLLDEWQTLVNDQTPAIRQAYLDDLLLAADSESRPAWTRWGWMARWSRRARWASLERTLQQTTPGPTVGAIDTDADQQSRRRRAFLTLLRSLSQESAGRRRRPLIRQLERKARARVQSAAQLVQRRPADLETPAYTVLASQKNVEIRRYEPFSVCTVPLSARQRAVNATTDATVSSPEQPSSRAFGSLAGYLFGKNQQGQAMKMTTPVLMSSNVDDSSTMSFVLPSEYWNQTETAPQPLSESGVRLEQKTGQDRAVVLFGGYASSSKVAQQKRVLESYLASVSSQWTVADAEFVVAQYNDPFTPPWKRLNEVSVAVVESNQ